MVTIEVLYPDTYPDVNASPLLNKISVTNLLSIKPMKTKHSAGANEAMLFETLVTTSTSILRDFAQSAISPNANFDRI